MVNNNKTLKIYLELEFVKLCCDICSLLRNIKKRVGFLTVRHHSEMFFFCKTTFRNIHLPKIGFIDDKLILLWAIQTAEDRASPLSNLLSYHFKISWLEFLKNQWYLGPVCR